jgi:acetyl-CoA acetyltransferase
VAFVVTSLDRARRSGKPVIRILAAQQEWPLGSEVMYNYYRPDLASQDHTSELARALWSSTGVSPVDIDVMTAYDNFSPQVHMLLEGYGFCRPGEARELISSGGIAPGGVIPVNTHGGLLGEAYIHGLNNVIEAVRQLRGEAPNQVDQARLALVAGRQTALLLGRE